eukprot:143006_1
MTGYTYCSVNVNRLVLHEEVNNKTPMLCFMQILFKEIESTNINVSDMQTFAQFITDNEYDTESLMSDIYDENGISNVRKYFEAMEKHQLFIIVVDIMNKFNHQPAQTTQKSEKCGDGLKQNVFDFPDCSYISTIITVLNQYST